MRHRMIGSAALAAGVAGLLSACGTVPGRDEGGSVLGNLIRYGGTTVPAPVQDAPIEVDCPTVTILDGSAALRSYSGGRVGDAEALRSQVSIANIARECAGQPDGSVVVKVGVEARALVGPAGGAGRYDAPIRVVVKRGDRVVANRLQRGSVTIPAGETQGSIVVVEEGILVPAGPGDLDIEVGLGGSEPAARRRRG